MLLDDVMIMKGNGFAATQEQGLKVTKQLHLWATLFLLLSQTFALVLNRDEYGVLKIGQFMQSSSLIKN